MNMAVLISAASLLALSFLVFVVMRFRDQLVREAQRLGYPSLSSYLRAAPRTDEEKRDAVSLALKGLVLCMLGLFFPPFLLLGLLPLFYGARKVAWASLGLGLVDDADQTGV